MASFERSSQGNAKFRISLSKSTPWYFGDTITGDVTVNVTNIFYLRGLLLVLRGAQQCTIIGAYAFPLSTLVAILMPFTPHLPLLTIHCDAFYWNLPLLVAVGSSRRTWNS